jgi:hypothetical protein
MWTIFGFWQLTLFDFNVNCQNPKVSDKDQQVKKMFAFNDFSIETKNSFPSVRKLRKRIYRGKQGRS